MSSGLSCSVRIAKEVLSSVFTFCGKFISVIQGGYFWMTDDIIFFCCTQITLFTNLDGEYALLLAMIRHVTEYGMLSS